MTLSCEAEVLPGLKEHALAEIKERLKVKLKILPSEREDRIRFKYPGKPDDLFSLRTIVAIYLIKSFPVPRPKSLLGDTHFSELAKSIKYVRSLHPGDTFKSFRINAAGKDSSVMQRISEAISKVTGLKRDDRDGSLLFRILPGSDRKNWEVLIRLTPRPLSTRAWRVCDMPGALNATIASAMLRLLPEKPQGRFLNLMCGSGTLLIERALQGSGEFICGGDINAATLNMSRRNISSAKSDQTPSLLCLDARRLPFADSSFTFISADFPWGERVGKKTENRDLYRKVSEEARRILRPDGVFQVITQESRLIEEILQDPGSGWLCQRTTTVFQGGYHPDIFMLQPG